MESLKRQEDIFVFDGLVIVATGSGNLCMHP
jgi:hypothetical protein